jgi:hypothetical protein
MAWSVIFVIDLVYRKVAYVLVARLNLYFLGTPCTSKWHLCTLYDVRVPACFQILHFRQHFITIISTVSNND